MEIIEGRIAWVMDTLQKWVISQINNLLMLFAQLPKALEDYLKSQQENINIYVQKQALEVKRSLEENMKWVKR